MESGASDLQIQQLLEDTQALLDAAVSADIDAIGRQLDARQTCVTDINTAGGFGDQNSPERQAVIDEILRIDKEACDKIRQLRNSSAKAMLEYSKAERSFGVGYWKKLRS